MSIYSDSYLFTFASRLLDRGMNTIDVADEIIRMGVDADRATQIVSQAFDPSVYR